MKKTLLITNIIPHYRIELYGLLSKYLDLTIAHTGNIINSSSFKQISIKERKIGPFIRYQNLPVLKQYDLIFIIGNPRLLNLYELLFKKKYNPPIFIHGMGVSASRNGRYDNSKLFSKIMKCLINRMDGAIFYDNYPFIKYSALGVNPNKLFVAQNTVVTDVNFNANEKEYKSILFLGTLYKNKGVDLLLKAYSLNIKKGYKMPPLNIVGDGIERQALQDLTYNLSLNSIVKFHGEIIDNRILSDLLKESYCCVSPNQAGLSVQKTMAYGVPILTKKYPRSGGEVNVIINEINGFFFDGTVIDLSYKLQKIIDNVDLKKNSNNCMTYYRHFNSPDVWLKGYLSVIDYISKK